MPNRIYTGIPRRTTAGGFEVRYSEDGQQGRLDPERSQKLVNHSPDGFNWGYGGSGPSQLALALLLEETTEEEALDLYQDFRREVVATWPQPPAGWVYTSHQIAKWLERSRAVSMGKPTPALLLTSEELEGILKWGKWKPTETDPGDLLLVANAQLAKVARWLREEEARGNQLNITGIAGLIEEAAGKEESASEPREEAKKPLGLLKPGLSDR